jgi:hypothetical protein
VAAQPIPFLVSCRVIASGVTSITRESEGPMRQSRTRVPRKPLPSTAPVRLVGHIGAVGLLICGGRRSPASEPSASREPLEVGTNGLRLCNSSPRSPASSTCQAIGTCKAQRLPAGSRRSSAIQLCIEVMWLFHHDYEYIAARNIACCISLVHLLRYVQTGPH